MAGHNFIRNEVFDENADRLNELTRFVMTQRKTAEYDATIAELEEQRIQVAGIVPRNQANIEAIVTRLANFREEKRLFDIETRAEIESNIEKWKTINDKKQEDVITSDFTLNIPEHSLEDWLAKLRAEGVKPLVNVHFKEVKDCLYKNTNAASYTEDEHEAGLAAKDVYFSGIANEEEWEQDKANKAYERGSKIARDRNAIARRQPQNWTLLKRAGLNDSRMEDTAIRYMDFQKRSEDRTPDWHAITRNLKLAGESVGYDERHYKHALDRLVSFFQPQLRPVTERMTAIELARFLLNLNVPDTEYDVIMNQMRGLTRKAGDRLHTVMSHLMALGQIMHKNLPEEEKQGKINTLMINGLLRFTTGQTKTSLAETIDDVNREQKKVSWEKFMTGVVKNESVHGYPATALSYNDGTNATTRLFNVDTRAGLHVGTVSDLVHQGLHLDDDVRLGRNTLLEENRSRKAEYDSDMRSQEERLIQRNRELEAKEVLRQLEAHRVDRAQRDREAEQARLVEEARTAAENLRRIVSRSQNNSRNKSETEDVFVDATGEDNRRPVRDRKKTEKYGTGATCNAFDTRESFDKNRRQSQSPNRQRSSSYDNKDRYSKSDKGNDKDRRSSDRSYKSSDRQSRPTSRDSSRQSRPESRDRNKEQGRQSFDRQRSTSRDRQYNNSRNDRNDKNRNNSSDRYQSKNYDSRQSRSTERGKSYSDSRNNSRNSSYDRNRSFDRSKDRYSSRDQNRGRNDSRDRKPSFERQRSNSRDRFQKEAPRQKDWNDQNWDRGNNCSRTYNPYKEKNCWKCITRDEHHEFECKLYDRISPRICRNCKAGYHYDRDCISKNDSRTNVTTAEAETLALEYRKN